MADIWTALIQNLNAMGFYGFVLPWLFIFAVVYGLLMKAGIFGDAKVNKPVSAILALVIAFFGTAIGGPQLAAFFISLFGEASIYIAGILVVILFLVLVGGPFALLGGEKGDKARGYGAWVVGIFLVVLAAIIFMTATGTIITGIALDETAIAALFVVVVIALAVWFIVTAKEEKKG